MTCPRRQQESPAQAQFCMKCGTGLTLTCASATPRCRRARPVRMRAIGDRYAGSTGLSPVAAMVSGADAGGAERCATQLAGPAAAAARSRT